MINIVHKEDCCGCSACAQKCPKQCITMKTDKEGFLYPHIYKEVCLDCGLCNKVCPVENPYTQVEPTSTYAAYSLNEEVRLQSSSGGMFSLLAEKTIAEGGIVFGARFNKEWQVELSYTETEEGISEYRGSKYLQANPLNVFSEVKEFLDSNREVLFSGTPCQVAGLKHFLIKDYENLITVDFICHGVPSPKVWEKYLKQVTENAERAIKDVAFRNKDNGWKKFCFDLETEHGAEYMRITSFFGKNHFMRAFLQNMILRPSCYACPSKEGRSHSDITIADFWGIQNMLPEMDDDRGTSLLMINTEKGRVILNDIKLCLKMKSINFRDAVSYNPSWYESSHAHPSRSDFFRQLNRTKDVISLIDFELTREQGIPLRNRIKQRLKRLLMWNVCS